MPNDTIFLKPGMTVNVDGVEMTFEEIMESKIDSIMYRKRLKDYRKCIKELQKQ